MITQKDVAARLGMDVQFVSDVLNEIPGVKASREDQDKIFQTARSMGYDFKKLKIGKRMDLRKEVIEEVIHTIEKHEDWGRKEILDHLRNQSGLMQRVHKKVFSGDMPGVDG